MKKNQTGKKHQSYSQNPIKHNPSPHTEPLNELPCATLGILPLLCDIQPHTPGSNRGHRWILQNLPGTAFEQHSASGTRWCQHHSVCTIGMCSFWRGHKKAGIKAQGLQVAKLSLLATTEPNRQMWRAQDFSYSSAAPMQVITQFQVQAVKHIKALKGHHTKKCLWNSRKAK